MQLTDRETVESISENPYMQYFIGLSGFEMKPPFHHSMMTHFRKRLTDVLAEINEMVATQGAKETKDDDNDTSGAMRGKAKRAYKKSASSVDRTANDVRGSGSRIRRTFDFYGAGGRGTSQETGES